MRNSKTTKELYDQMIQMTDIHSKTELNGEILIWMLFDNAHVVTTLVSTLLVNLDQ